MKEYKVSIEQLIDHNRSGGLRTMMPDRGKVISGLHDIGGFIAGRIGVEQARNFLRTIDDAIEVLKELEAIQKSTVQKTNRKGNQKGDQWTSDYKRESSFGKTGSTWLESG